MAAAVTLMAAGGGGSDCAALWLLAAAGSVLLKLSRVLRGRAAGAGGVSHSRARRLGLIRLRLTASARQVWKVAAIADTSIASARSVAPIQ